MKKLILFLFFFVPLLAQAYTAKIDGIYYDFYNNGAVVTYYSYYDNANAYSGAVTIPSSVTYNSKRYSVISIGSKAFYGCSGLTSITIPSSVTGIGSHAFCDCSGLTSVNIPNSVTSIGDYAFTSCSGLTSVNIPNSVTSIGSSAFSSCSGLTSVNIPNSVTSIGSSAFSGCSSLTSVNIPNSVTSIGSSAFDGCSGLTSVNIPNSVTSIGDSAFWGCSGLTSVNIPNSVTSIGDYAFSFCSGLTSVNIPNSVTSIGESAFFFCSGLTEPIIVNDMFVYLPKGKGHYTIPSGITKIIGGAFGICFLTAVTIPSSVTSIEHNVFSSCSLLTSLTNLREIPQSSNGDLPETCTVHVPAGCKEAYKQSTAWSAYNIVDDVDTSVKVSSINLSATSLEVQLGEEFELTATVLPNDADNKEVEWTIFSYQLGVLYHLGDLWFAAGEGTATITATAKDGSGVSASCTVTVVSGGDDTPSDDIIPSTNIDDFDNTLYFNDVEHRAGDFNLALNMKCAEENITAFQCDIYLPEGVTWKSTTDRRGNVVYTLPTFNEDRTDNSYHSISPITLNNDGSYRMVVCSMANEIILETDGAILTLPLSISEEMEAGDYNLIIKDIVVTDVDEQQTTIDEVVSHLTIPNYTVGDVNDDGVINVTDVVSTIAYILGDHSSDFIFSAGDVNEDGVINVTDVVSIIDIILHSHAGSTAAAKLMAIRKTLASGDTNNLEIIPFTIAEGTNSSTVKLNLNNPGDEFTAFQCDIQFPEGIDWEYAVDKRGNMKYTVPVFDSEADRTDASYHSVSLEKTDGIYRVVVSSMANETILGEEGAVLDIPFVYADGIAPGIYDVSIRNMVITRADKTDVKPADYTFSILVGSPAESSITLNGNFTDEAINEYNTALAGNTTVAAIDLSNAVNVSNNTTIATGNENLVLYVAEGKTVANTNNVVTGDECSKLVLTDGYSFSAPNTFTAASASYSRTMGTTWGTVCLPYEVQSNDDVEYYQIEGIQDNVLVLAQCATLPANTPALMKKLSGDAVVCSASNVAVGGAMNETPGTVTMHGSYANDTRVEDANAYYIKNDKFWLNNGHFFIDAFRAYFTTNNVGAKSLNIEGLATGIDALMNSNNSVIGVWDANGVKRGSVDNGMNVVKMNNGKSVKIFVK